MTENERILVERIKKLEQRLAAMERREYTTGGGSAELTEKAVGYGDSGNTLTGDASQFNYDDVNHVLVVGNNEAPSITVPGIWSIHDGGSAHQGVVSYGGIPMVSGWTAKGTKNDPQALAEGSSALWVSAVGWAAGAFQPAAAYIKAIATEAWTNVAQGMKWLFQVTKTGTLDLVDALELTGNQATFGVPVQPYADNKSTIESLTGIDEGVVAYALDTHKFGYKNNTAWVWLSGEPREILTADRNYYVRTDGNDANDGLSDTSGGAFKTINAAIDFVANNLDLNGYTVTINIGAGTFTGQINLKSCVGVYATGKLRLIGSNSTTLNNTGTVVRANNVTSPWNVGGFKISNSSSGHLEPIRKIDLEKGDGTC